MAPKPCPPPRPPGRWGIFCIPRDLVSALPGWDLRLKSREPSQGPPPQEGSTSDSDRKPRPPDRLARGLSLLKTTESQAGSPSTVPICFPQSKPAAVRPPSKLTPPHIGQEQPAAGPGGRPSAHRGCCPSREQAGLLPGTVGSAPVPHPQKSPAVVSQFTQYQGQIIPRL